MKPKHLLYMLVGVVLLWGGTTLLNASRGGDKSSPKGQLFTGLKQEVNQVQRLVIQRGADSWAFDRGSEGVWTMPAMGGYPADRKKLDTLVLALARSERNEAKTSKPELYESLGLAELDASEAAAPIDPMNPAPAPTGPSRVEVFGRQDKSLGTVWIGKRRSGSTGDAYFVRLGGDPTCWVASGNLRVETKQTAYLDSKLVEVPSADMKAVRIVHPDGEQVLLARAADATSNDPLAILNLPEGKEPQSEWVTSRFASALQSVTINDVRPASEITFPEGDTTVSDYWTKQGMRVTVRSFEEMGILYASFETKYDPEGAPTTFVGPGASGKIPDVLDSGTEGDTPEVNDAVDSDVVKTQVAAINEKAKGWVYELPSWKGSGLRSRMDELLKKEGDDADPFAVPGPEGAITPTVSLPTPEGGNPFDPTAISGDSDLNSELGGSVPSAGPQSIDPSNAEPNALGTPSKETTAPNGTGQAVSSDTPGPSDPSILQGTDPSAGAGPAGPNSAGSNGEPTGTPIGTPEGSPPITTDQAPAPNTPEKAPKKEIDKAKPVEKKSDPVFEIDPDAVKGKGKGKPEPKKDAPMPVKDNKGGKEKIGDR